MIWKIFFWILCALIFALACFGGYITEFVYEDIIWYKIIIMYLAIASIMFIIGHYFALGWNKKMYPKWLAYLGLVIGGFVILFCIIANIIEYIGLTKNEPAATFAIGAIVLFIILAIQSAIMFFPTCFPLIRYLKRYDSLEEIDKPFFKTYAVSEILFIPSYLFVFLGNLDLISQFNVWDYFYMLVIPIFALIFTIGYSFNKKIFNKKLWQFSIIPFILISIGSNLFMSEILATVMKPSRIDIPIDIAFLILDSYILIKYAFDDKIFNNELKIEEKVNE